MEKCRLDVWLVELGHFPSREKARAAIMAGQVRVDGRVIDKPGRLVDRKAVVEVEKRQGYVSRGGFKLEKAIISFGLDLHDRVVLDVGASTGGFTDCALKHGARLVLAVDVGYGQLAWELRRNPKVVVLERTNIRHLTADALPAIPDFATVDVSFISLKLVLPKIDELTGSAATCVALVKPQFEAGREKVGKNGVVRDPAVHEEVLNGVIGTAHSLKWGVRGLDFSPIRGPKGNIEYLVCFEKGFQSLAGLEERVAAVVREAHLFFGKPSPPSSGEG